MTGSFFSERRASVCGFLLLLFVCPLAPATAQQSTVTWIASTGDKPWQTLPAPALQTAEADKPAQVRVAPGKTFQSIDGFGGCFNELGWDVLLKSVRLSLSRVKN
jgi:glucosylceramidase